ncbi:PAS domain-containing protein [Cellulomonas sp. NPDC055163]
MDGALRDVARSRVFLDSPAAYILLDREFRIRGVNDTYARATRRAAETLLGLHMFEAFPDNPDDPTANGVAMLSASLELVRSQGVAHDMLVQRYDIPDATTSTSFVARTWSPVNSPVLDDTGRVVGVLHHVEDITALSHLTGTAPAVEAESEALGNVATPGRSASGLRAVLRGLVAAVEASRAEQEALTSANQRLTDALVTSVLSRGTTGPAAARTRREQLWRRTVDDTASPRWTSWCDALCRAAVREIPQVGGASLSLRIAPGHYELLAATDRWAAELDELHLATGEGPALEAMDSGLPVLAADLSRDARWPWYTSTAATAGAAAAFTFPVRLDAGVAGCLSLVSRHPGPLTPGATADAAILVDLITVAVTQDLDGILHRTFFDPAAVGTEGYRAVVIASALLAQRHSLTVQDAVARMRAAAFSRGVPLGQVAAGVLDGRIVLD